jgi:hypothetical protein
MPRYCHLNKPVQWLVDNLGMPPGFGAISELTRKAGKGDAFVTLLGFDLVNQSMNAYVCVRCDNPGVLDDIFRRAAVLCGAGSVLPKDLSLVRKDNTLDMAITYSFKTHGFVRVGTYCVWDLHKAATLDGSQASERVCQVFERVKSGAPIEGLLPNSHFMVGHTFSAKGMSYAKYEVIQHRAFDLGWKYLYTAE